MNLTDFKMLTVVCEPVVSATVIEVTRSYGATGFTVTEVYGEGKGENSSGEVPGVKSKIEIIAEMDLALKIMDALAQKFFKNYGVILFLSDIAVLRPEKFINHERKEKT